MQLSTTTKGKNRRARPGPASIPGRCYTLLLSRDPSTWSALEESSFVSRGREPLPCRYTTSNQTKRTSPGSEHAHLTELNTTYFSTYALVSPCRSVRGHLRTGSLVTAFQKWLKSQTDLFWAFLAALMQL